MASYMGANQKQPSDLKWAASAKVDQSGLLKSKHNPPPTAIEETPNDSVESGPGQLPFFNTITQNY